MTGSNLTTTTTALPALDEQAKRHLFSSTAWAAARVRDEWRARKSLRSILPLLPQLLTDAQGRLQPASPQEIIGTLAPVLALVGASGMTQQDRTEWLAAATDTLKGIPVDLLIRAAKIARRDCDHPSKVIPAMLAEAEGSWRQRRADRADAIWLADLARQPQPEITEEDCCTPEQAKAAREEINFRIPEEDVRKPIGPLRQPTADELIEIAKEVQVPRGNPNTPVANIAGLSIAQIFEQRDRIRAARVEQAA